MSQKKRPRYFVCPHCHRKVEKSPPIVELGRTGAGMLGYKHYPCPLCGGIVDVMKVADGDYDPPPGMPKTIVWILVLVTIAALAVWVLNST